MYIFNGPNILKGQGPGHIVDILPTIYALLGVELPTYIDGRPMQDMFRQPIPVKYQQTDDSQKKHPSGHEALSKEQELRIMERLKALGYTQ
jgi:arylsulfatase A-like enzyme